MQRTDGLPSEGFGSRVLGVSQALAEAQGSHTVWYPNQESESERNAIGNDRTAGVN